MRWCSLKSLRVRRWFYDDFIPSLGRQSRISSGVAGGGGELCTENVIAIFSLVRKWCSTGLIILTSKPSPQNMGYDDPTLAKMPSNPGAYLQETCTLPKITLTLFCWFLIMTIYRQVLKAPINKQVLYFLSFQYLYDHHAVIELEGAGQGRMRSGRRSYPQTSIPGSAPALVYPELSASDSDLGHIKIITEDSPLSEIAFPPQSDLLSPAEN